MRSLIDPLLRFYSLVIASCRRGSPKSEHQIVDAHAPRAGQSKSQRRNRVRLPGNGHPYPISSRSLTASESDCIQLSLSNGFTIAAFFVESGSHRFFQNCHMNSIGKENIAQRSKISPIPSQPYTRKIRARIAVQIITTRMDRMWN